MKDPLSQVYTGRDNSGGAIIFEDNTPDPVPTLLTLLQRKSELAAKERALAAAAKAKNSAYKDVPNYVGASYDIPYLTKLRDDLVQKSRPLYDGTLPAEAKPQLQSELDASKGRAFALAHKSAALDRQFQEAYKDFSQRPWAYYPDFEEKAKEWVNTPLDQRGEFRYKKRNESDYVKSMQGVDIKPHVTAWDKDVANGRMQRTEMHKLVNGAIDKGWQLWSSNTNSPDVMALYDHADEELRKKWGDKYDSFEPDKKHELINKMGKQLFAESQGLKLGADGNWVTTYKTTTKNAPKGAVTKQKTIDEMDNIQYDNSYNTTTPSKKATPQASYTIVEPKKSAATLQLSSDMYDPLTKQSITATGPIDFIPGQIHVGRKSTVEKGSKKQLTSVFVPYVTGSYKVSEPIMGKDNKPEKDASGNVKYKTVNKSIIVPLKDMEGVFKENGEQYQWAYDLAEKLNNESLTPEENADPYWKNLK